ncbi:MAG: 4-alpha-glucanotransferase [Spirochaetes bacterium]|nr:4-alpha-glucanotransferase [Spirochaetota bacterium]
MNLERSCGILCHISSLPGRYGHGTLGSEAFEFADFLKRSGQSFWQVLPIHPVKPVTCYSPYDSSSTFAGNTDFINLEELKEFSWYSDDIVAGLQEKDTQFCNFDEISEINHYRLKLALQLFLTSASAEEKNSYSTFCKNNKYWLEDYSLFSSLAAYFKTDDWLKWDFGYARRNSSQLSKWKTDRKDEQEFYKFTQYLFYHQWNKLKKYCNEHGIKLIGDIPFYVSFSSSDVWANNDIFQLDKKSSEPVDIAGVPPDYFSETGQRWGNPLYKWFSGSRLNSSVVDWWIKRIRHLTQVVDIVRIDHFRAFESYWAIPATEKTAVNGEWRKGPGIKFFHEVQKALGDLPLIAEDLGMITPEVQELRDRLNLPGMKILQFAFDQNNKNPYITHNIRNSNCIIYTGTHDNNTTNGWYYSDELSWDNKNYLKRYLGINHDHEMHKLMIREAYKSVADVVLIPVQDVLGLGQEHRMNTPGTLNDKNWSWKLKKGMLTIEHELYLNEQAQFYNRTLYP